MTIIITIAVVAITLFFVVAKLYSMYLDQRDQFLELRMNVSSTVRESELRYLEDVLRDEYGIYSKVNEFPVRRINDTFFMNTGRVINATRLDRRSMNW